MMSDWPYQIDGWEQYCCKFPYRCIGTYNSIAVTHQNSFLNLELNWTYKANLKSSVYKSPKFNSEYFKNIASGRNKKVDMKVKCV